MRLLLLRHGQTHANVAGALDTADPGLDLTDLGHTQATAAAQALTDAHVDAIYVSSRVRTHQTAAPLSRMRRLRPAQVAGLEEISAGDYEMACDEDSVAGYHHAVRSWIEGELGVRMPGGETGDEFLRRYDAAIERVAQADHAAALVVSHGAAIRTWVSAQLSPSIGEPGATEVLHNTALITLEGRPGRGWELVDWHGEPIGGRFLEDEAAPDPTGDLDADD